MKVKLLKLLIIPFFLTLGYFILITYPYFYSKINRYDSLGFLSLVEEKELRIKESGKADNHLVKEEKIAGKFKATENNLGIVLVKFTRFGKVLDQVEFRLGEEGKKIWYYKNKYRAAEFQNNQYFTFGFPPVVNSKNKNYFFEIESLAGTYKNGVGVSLGEPQVALVYKYTRDDLLNLDTLSSFIFKKSIYVVRSVNFLQNWQILSTFVLSLFFILLIQKKKIKIPSIVRFLPQIKTNSKRTFRQIISKIKSNYLSPEKKTVKFSKRVTRNFALTKLYLRFLNTNTKKRLAVGLFIFFLALTYRYSSSLVNLDKLFYAGLGGGGDYDQFVRAATCALSFCSWILHQNLLIGSSILGVFYQVFGFTGGLKAYLYLMIILSSIVAPLPYVLLSRKNWITIGGAIGSFFLATSDFLTEVALNFPPDNGSTFIFSMFFIVYLLTMHFGTIRWLLFFGFVGFFDGMFKALFLINDLITFVLFVPIAFFEKAKGKGKSLFRKQNIRILLLSLIPLLVFLVLYSAWEYFVYIKFSMYYFLRGLLLSGGASYVSYTSLAGGSSGEAFVSQLFYLLVSVMVMIKRLIQYVDLHVIFLAPIFFGLFFFSFIILPQKTKFPTRKFIVVSILSIVTIVLLVFIKNDYFKIHQVFAGEYIIDNWTDQTYINIFLFAGIITLFIVNFKYTALKLSLPIIPYIIMLIILTKNSPFPRISTQVVAWSIILFAYIIDWIIMNINGYSIKRIRILFTCLILILFISMHSLPKMVVMISQLYSGIAESQSTSKYLKWVNSQLPNNSIILAGGKSDLVTLGESLKNPIVYNVLWNAAVIIKPNEIPGVSPTDFSIIPELKNKDNFKRNKYIILEDDVYIWRGRLTGTGDGVFTTDPKSTTALHARNFSLRVYKSNPTLKKAIYELKLKKDSSN